MKAKSFRVQAMAYLLTGCSLAFLAQPAMAQDADCDPEAEDCEVDDTIVVTGIRAAIQSATNAKRESDQITDVIDAEDIGDLPDTNVAEALQRVTGVQINRDLGEGSEIAVRGFSQNRVEINGQTQVGAGAGGDVTYQAITSDAFRSIEVIKTPAADEVEGALGAIIRFNTRRPLDSRRNLLSASVDAQFAERADAWTNNANLLGSYQFESSGGTRFGILGNLTYRGRRLRQDFLDIRGWDAVDGFGRDLDGDGVAGELVERDEDGFILDLQDGAYVPLQTRLQVREQDRELYTATFSFQAETEGGFELFADARFTRNEAGDTQFQYTSSFNSALQGPPDALRIRPVYQQPENALISDNQTVLNAILGQVRPNGNPQRGVNLNISGNSAPNEQEVLTLALGASWEVGDRLDMSVEFNHGTGNQVNDQFFSSSGVAFSEWPFYFYDFSTGTDLPTIVPLVRGGNGDATTEFTDDRRVDLLDLNTYRFNNIVAQRQMEENYETAARIDFDYDFRFGPIYSLEFGGRITEEVGRRSRLRGRDTNNTDADGNLGGLSFDELEARFPGIIVQQPYGDLFDGATGDFPREWFSLDSAFIRDNYDEILADGGIVRTLDRNWGFDVSRNTIAAYLLANYEFALGGVNAFGNFGVRYVATDRVATGGVDAGNDTFIPLTVEQDYDNWLPSANLVMDLGDGFYARFGAARSMARPRLIDVAPLVNIQFFAGAGRGGNPLLEPEEVTQFDVSFEKYYGEGNLVSVALFYKDFSQRIEEGIFNGCFPLPSDQSEDSPGDDGCLVGEDLIRVNSPVNAGATEVRGVEIAWQQSLDFLPSPLDGFGFIANYTYVDADEDTVSLSGLTLPTQDLSEHSYNLIGYFEKWGFEARAAYNWRSEFYDERSTTNQASFAEPYGQLDASIGYQITPSLSIRAEAINILNEPEIRYQEIAERPLGYRVNDRRFLIGISWRMR
ncbi:TonB-dependent receptor [Aurantiacibacter sp. MUD61]|uniref:TonB-dependent receptor n=1 Tax=Aurantiacibacter sp. MUD61 TaxID=3009083 RepID=UPI0022EFE574|nr:TonB-dependent receptor [Aurantiacibacter sp. MUD61]